MNILTLTFTVGRKIMVMEFFYSQSIFNVQFYYHYDSADSDRLSVSSYTLFEFFSSSSLRKHGFYKPVKMHDWYFVHETNLHYICFIGIIVNVSFRLHCSCLCYLCGCFLPRSSFEMVIDVPPNQVNI